MKRHYLLPVVFSILFPTVNLFAQNAIDSLDQKIMSLMEQGHLFGVGTAIFDENEIKYIKGFGKADLKADVAYNPAQTIQNIASISKTFIGVALMKAVEMGSISLDTKINDLLPFEIINPHFPDEPILVRHLANHTSSLKDNRTYERAYILQEPSNYTRKELPKDYRQMSKLYTSNKDMPLPDFIKKIANKKGDWYKKKNFWKEPPGKKFSYSNVGAGLAAYVLEIATGMTFPDFTQKYILDPLGMDESGWTIASVNMANHTNLHMPNGLIIPKYMLITYADGGFMTSVKDLTSYLQEMMKCRVGKGTLLKQASCELMMTNQVNENNYAFFWETTKSGRIGHNGGDPGVVTFMYFDPETNLGEILFCNTDINSKEAVDQLVGIWNLLKVYANRL